MDPTQRGVQSGVSIPSCPHPPFAVDPNELAEYARQQVRELFASLGVETPALALTISSPEGPAVADYRLENLTLRAGITLSWSDHGTLSLTFPHPWHGVFLLHKAAAPHAEELIWHPRLMPAPGLRRVRSYHLFKRMRATIDWLEYALAAGCGLRFPLMASVQGQTADQDAEELCRTAVARYQKRGARPLRSCIRLLALPQDFEGCAQAREFQTFVAANPVLRSATDPARQQLAACFEALARNLEPSSIPLVDSQSLDGQRLYTYSAYLVDHLISFLIRRLVPGPRSRAAAGLAPGSPAQRAALEQAWAKMCADGRAGDLRIPTRGLRKLGWMVPFHPLNAIEAASQLTGLQRYDMRGKSLERLPPLWRQNHPSFKGRVCCVESPESKKVGLDLHLARGAAVNAAGIIQQGEPVVGYAASMIPCCCHDDGVRVMMGAKNLKQALPVKGATPPSIPSGHEQELKSLLAPLCDAGLLPGEQRYFSPGVDLLVAYLPWYGYNVDDGIVASRRLATERILDWEMPQEGVDYVLPRLELCPPPDELTPWFDPSTMLRKPGAILPGEPLAFFLDRTRDTMLSVAWKGERSADLARIEFVPPASPIAGGVIRWKAMLRRPFGVGDKLMGRHGNKGIVATLVSSEELPRLPDDPRLPPDLRGRAVDLVLNPHGVISRMNLGQLLEAQLGLLSALFPAKREDLRRLGAQFGTVDISELKALFRQVPGATADGRMHLIMPDGSKSRAPVVVGFQYFVRLKHIPCDKAQARALGTRPGSYSLVTGQPLGGRRRGGGLRLGEMEMWALAARRADPMIVSTLSEGATAPGTGADATFQAIRDHLFATGILLDETEGSFRVCLASPDAVRQRGKPVSDPGVWRLSARSRFRCREPECQYIVPGGLLRATGKSERSEEVFLSVADVLERHGIPREDVYHHELELGAGAVTLPLLRTRDDKGRTVDVTATWKPGKKSVTVFFELRGIPYAGYCQWTSGTGRFPTRQLSSLRVSCWRHKSKPVRAFESKPGALPTEGGLADEAIFGGPIKHRADTGWGFIELPFACRFPPGWFKSKDLRTACIQALPILPLKYRYPYPRVSAAGEVVHTDDLTHAYADLIVACNAWHKAPESKRAYKDASIVALVHGILKTIRARLTGKHGLMREHALGRRTDWSARLVIVPAPDLSWDECGLPLRALLLLLGDELTRDRAESSDGAQVEAWEPLRARIRGLAGLNREGEDFATSGRGQALESLCLSPEEEGLGRKVIQRWLEQHEDFVVVLNRQPSLQAHSIQAFKPRLNTDEAGYVLRLPPLACKGFGADFDGDEMVVHVPRGADAQAAARRMLPSSKESLFMPATDLPAASFEQDFVLGHHVGVQGKEVPALLDSEPASGCQTCKDLFPHGSRFLAHVCEEHPDSAGRVIVDWMRWAYGQATKAAVSFGFVDLADCLPADREELLSGLADRKDANRVLDERTIESLRDRTSGDDYAKPGRGLALLAISGARGRKQVRQLVTARGHLLPGDGAFDWSPAEYFFRACLLDGMTEEEFFRASYNARSSMLDKKLGTPTAGALTRRLVLACWPLQVTRERCDQSDDKRSPVWCRVAGGLCAECYGQVRGVGRVPVGYPAGLMAALAIGERGTQLSMQSFHTGERAISIGDILAILGGTDPAFGNKNWFEFKDGSTGFLERMKKTDAYKDIAARHLEVIFRQINLSETKSLDGAIRARVDLFQELVSPMQWQAIERHLMRSAASIAVSPWAMLMRGAWTSPARSGEAREDES